MYTNPSSDNLQIQLPTGVSQAKVHVFDLTGRLLKSSNITTLANKVAVNELSTGIYLIKINADGKIGSRQFIKK